MTNLLYKSLRALTLLSEGQYTLEQLSDKMGATKRHVQKVLKGLRNSGFVIQCDFIKRIKHFSINPETHLLCAILSPAEQAALNSAISAQNADLQAAVYKLIQLSRIQLSVNVQKR